MIFRPREPGNGGAVADIPPAVSLPCHLVNFDFGMEASKEDLQCNSKAEESTTTSRDRTMSGDGMVTTFRQVLYAIGELGGEMIKPSSTNTPTPPKIKNSYRWFPYFRDCIGANDGTHVTAKLPRSLQHRGRKHHTSQNVLAAMDFDMRFTYVLAGWEGSTHDGSILVDSLSRPDGLQIRWGEDDFFQEGVTFDEVETGHGVEADDNEVWKEKRQEWADTMWEATTTI
ncbi:hypothetical protein QYE76_029320 [Lolium multiflorum]|uniref:DDE Tnp4 domain-containing protein n=1 Tax=Lolium multiflorum TaxID=4521 RepID=A0AAD8QNE6_LOLMU|nr:hypothetical protein QYE76_029320 [Lolium multiflorum]